MRRISRLGLAALALAIPEATRAAGDPASGAALARTWCRSCHAVEAAPARGTDAVPAFSAIAAAPDTTAERLLAFLEKPHGQMPDLTLSGQQADNLVAYILSLRPH